MSGNSAPHNGSDPDFPYFSVDSWFQFPDPQKSGTDIVGSGGNLSPGMLLSAYRQGIFPWYGKDEPILWWSPDPRFVLLPQDFHVPSRLDRVIKTNKSGFTYTMDKSFFEVIKACAAVKRPEQDGTWITDAMIDSYAEFHRLGFAHSFETWQNGSLAGGFYGVLLGQVFFGESMFSFVPDASKCAFVRFVRAFGACGGKLIDSQVYTDHIARFGGKNISRDAFLRLEKSYLHTPLQANLKEAYILNAR